MNIVIDLNGDFGKEAYAARKLDITDTNFLGQINDAQWPHALTGEMDPNSGNMRLEQRPRSNGTVTEQLKLVDVSFGQNAYDPATAHSRKRTYAQLHSPAGM